MKKERVSFGSLLKFFLPLATTPLMIGLAHSIINTALARLPYPEASLAAFTIVRSIVMIIATSSLLNTQLVVSFLEGQQSYNYLKKFSWIMGFILFSILVVISYTSLGRWIMTNLIGLKGQREIEFGYKALRVACFLPLMQTLRNFYQGIALSLKKTRLYLPGIILRLIVITVFLWWSVKTQAVPGVIAGSLTWVAGIGIEGIFIFISLIFYYGSIKNSLKKLPRKSDNRPLLSEIIRFFLPLAVMMTVTAFLQPVIQGGIARGLSPTLSLAAYGVGWSLVALIAGPLRSLHQVALVFTDSLADNNWHQIKLFSLYIGLFLSLVIIILSLTPAGFWVLNSIIGVSVEIANISQKVMLAFGLFPLVSSFREAYWGVLMKQRNTNYIGLSKSINLLTVFSTLLIGIKYIHLEPAVIGALALTAGEIADSILIWYICTIRGKALGSWKFEVGD